MKFILILCVASVCGAGGLVLAQSLQQPQTALSAAPQLTWSHPSLVVPHGHQTRYALAPRGNQTASTSDVLVRFELIPESTLLSLRKMHPNLIYSRPHLTAAHVTVDALNDQLPPRVVKASLVPDGSGAFEARVPAPVGGWLLQPLRIQYAAYSGVEMLFSSDGIVTFAP